LRFPGLGFAEPAHDNDPEGAAEGSRDQQSEPTVRDQKNDEVNTSKIESMYTLGRCQICTRSFPRSASGCAEYLPIRYLSDEIYQ
jgi:hypothetical protein